MKKAFFECGYALDFAPKDGLDCEYCAQFRDTVHK